MVTASQSVLYITLNKHRTTLPCNVSFDGNGNVCDYIDTNGASMAHHEYSPFGETVASSGSKASEFTHRFSTKLYDSDTGLVRYELRTYSTELGRWLSRDPIEERGGLNLYGFVGNSPLWRLDVAGLLIWKRGTDMKETGTSHVWPAGAEPRTLSNGEAVTHPIITISFECVRCTPWRYSRDWRLSGATGITVEYHNRSTYHPDILKDAAWYEWAQRAEGDHIADFDVDALAVWKPLAVATEAGLWGRSWTSKDACGEAIAEIFYEVLYGPIHDSVWASINRWDSGLHTYGNVQGRRP